MRLEYDQAVRCNEHRCAELLLTNGLADNKLFLSVKAGGLTIRQEGSAASFQHLLKYSHGINAHSQRVYAGKGESSK